MVLVLTYRPLVRHRNDRLLQVGLEFKHHLQVQVGLEFNLLLHLQVAFNDLGTLSDLQEQVVEFNDHHQVTVSTNKDHRALT